MADSDTTQQADMKKLLDEANALIARCEAHENSRAEREADAPSRKKAGPFLTTSQWLMAVGLGASLIARPFYGELSN